MLDLPLSCEGQCQPVRPKDARCVGRRYDPFQPNRKGEAVASRRPTMPDVARLAGVSIKTVSRVVNNEPNVSAATLKRVLGAIDELGFRRNDMARNLRAGLSSATIGLIIEDLGNPFYGTVARAVEDVARRHGALVMAASSEEDHQREKELVGALLQRRVDGLVIVPASGDHGYLQREMALGTPVVFLDRPADGAKADTVVLDNRGGARLGAEHLFAQGHRRIGVLGNDPGIFTIKQRLAGFLAAAEAAAGPFDDRFVVLDCQDPAGATRVASEMLGRRHPPTAFFALNNRMTVGVARAVWQHGSDAPVVGFDDLELAEMLPVSVTVISGDAAAMGRRGAELLFDRLDGRAAGPPRRAVVPTALTSVSRARPVVEVAQPAR